MSIAASNSCISSAESAEVFLSGRCASVPYRMGRIALHDVSRHQPIEEHNLLERQRLWRYLGNFGGMQVAIIRPGPIVGRTGVLCSRLPLRTRLGGEARFRYAPAPLLPRIPNDFMSNCWPFTAPSHLVLLRP